MPAVQKPHWSAWWSWKDSCSGPGARPSIVRTSQPSAWIASVRQERTGSPSSWTVHAPHDALLAADLGAGQARGRRMKSRQQRARLDLGRVLDAVDPQLHARPAWTSARRVSSATSARRCAVLDALARRAPRPRAALAPSTQRLPRRASRRDRRRARRPRRGRGRARPPLPACGELAARARVLGERGPGTGLQRRHADGDEQLAGRDAVVSGPRKNSSATACACRPPSAARSARRARAARPAAGRAGRRARPSRRRCRARGSRRGRRGAPPGRAAASDARPAPSVRAPPGGRWRRSAASLRSGAGRQGRRPRLMSTIRAGRARREVEQRHQALTAREHTRSLVERRRAPPRAWKAPK